MNCHDAREWLSEMIDDALEAEVRAQVDAHLANCADCRRELERLGATVSLLRAVERPQVPVGFAERVLAAARPAPRRRGLRDRLAAPGGGSDSPSRPQRWSWWRRSRLMSFRRHPL